MKNNTIIQPKYKKKYSITQKDQRIQLRKQNEFTNMGNNKNNENNRTSTSNLQSESETQHGLSKVKDNLTKKLQSRSERLEPGASVPMPVLDCFDQTTLPVSFSRKEVLPKDIPCEGNDKDERLWSEIDKGNNSPANQKQHNINTNNNTNFEMGNNNN